jgi:hypothetical protein
METGGMKYLSIQLMALLLTILATTLITRTGYAANSIPTITELENATYMGIEDHPVTLSNGRWEGQPFTEGGASKPSVGLFKDIYITGDLNSDGIQEALAVLWQNAGGTGSYIYIAVMSKQNTDVKNLATTLVGDRVKLRAGSIESGKIILKVLQAGENDAMCCPGELVTRIWSLIDEQLQESETTRH